MVLSEQFNNMVEGFDEIDKKMNKKNSKKKSKDKNNQNDNDKSNDNKISEFISACVHFVLSIILIALIGSNFVFFNILSNNAEIQALDPVGKNKKISLFNIIFNSRYWVAPPDGENNEDAEESDNRNENTDPKIEGARFSPQKDQKGGGGLNKIIQNLSKKIEDNYGEVNDEYETDKDKFGYNYNILVRNFLNTQNIYNKYFLKTLINQLPGEIPWLIFLFSPILFLVALATALLGIFISYYTTFMDLGSGEGNDSKPEQNIPEPIAIVLYIILIFTGIIPMYCTFIGLINLIIVFFKLTFYMLVNGGINILGFILKKNKKILFFWILVLILSVFNKLKPLVSEQVMTGVYIAYAIQCLLFLYHLING